MWIREPKKLCFIDLETSGLVPGEHVILSIGAIVANQEFSALIVPTDAEWARTSSEALDVNGLTLDVLRYNGQPLREVANMFAQWLFNNGIVFGKGQFVGQNPAFDLGFLAHFLADEFAFYNITRHLPIDVRDMYSRAINAGLVIPVGKYRDSHTISKSLGLPEEPWPHDALEGARAVRRHYEKLTELLSKVKLG